MGHFHVTYMALIQISRHSQFMSKWVISDDVITSYGPYHM